MRASNWKLLNSYAPYSSAMALTVSRESYSTTVFVFSSMLSMLGATSFRSSLFSTNGATCPRDSFSRLIFAVRNLWKNHCAFFAVSFPNVLLIFLAAL